VQSQDTFGRRATRAFTRLLVTLVVLGLGGVVVVLLSQLNARTFRVEQQEEQLVVMKGRLLPWGHVRFAPGDPRLADAYAPLPSEGQAPANLVGPRFEDREELDRALFEVLTQRGSARIQSDEPRLQQEGLTYLRRAELLSGITDEQRRALKALQADAAFFQARSQLEDARKLVAEAMVQLRLAAESSSRNARAANQMLSAVGPEARALEEALRRSVHTLSGPAAPSAPEPSAQPEQPQQLPPEGTPAPQPAPPAPEVGGSGTPPETGTP
jgi:hypothetical protein